MHATYTVHAMPDSHIAAGHLRDGDRYDSLPVLSFFSTALATPWSSATCDSWKNYWLGSITLVPFSSELYAQALGLMIRWFVV